MEQLRQYVVSVVAGAFVCGIALGLFPKGSGREILKMLCGLFLALTVLGPVAKLDLSELENFYGGFSVDAAQTAALGEAYSEKALRECIKTRTEAYILDKAEGLGAQVAVQVSLSPDALPVPAAVQITGAISPYVKYRLSEYISQDLGVPKENQVWTT